MRKKINLLGSKNKDLCMWYIAELYIRLGRRMKYYGWFSLAAIYVCYKGGRKTCVPDSVGRSVSERESICRKNLPSPILQLSR